MKNYKIKVNIIFTLLCLTIICIVFNACQKNIDYSIPTNVPSNDIASTVQTSLLSGFVTDENNNPVFGAAVTSGTTANPVNTFTDKFGYFEFKNITVVKNAAVVTVNKSGYFKGIKTYLATANKGAFFRIKLLPKTNAGTIAATSGGAVTLINGLKIEIPANGVVNKASNIAYTGTITVSAQSIDPTVNNINEIMPGDLRGLDAQNQLKLLTSYGMAAVELTGASGELLQIAPNKQATLSFPIPTTLQTASPSSIPLWSFDESNGLWKQEGTATKTGNFYIGNVSHFSFWNCDYPNNYVQFSCTVVDNAGQPLQNSSVKISDMSNSISRWGITDNTGFVSGPVPDNANLTLDIYTSFECSSFLFTQNFSTTNVSVALGSIMINNSTSIATINGTVTNCNNLPINSATIIVNVQGRYYNINNIASNGSFSFPVLICGGLTTTISLIVADYATNQQSANTSYTINSGINNIGNIQACGINTTQYFNYTINGTTYSILQPTGYYYYKDSLNSISISSSSLGLNSNIQGSISMQNQGIGLGSNQTLNAFAHIGISQLEPTTIPNPIMVHITEYGNIGEYVSGNFSGILVGANPPFTPYAVTCNYRIKRQ